LARRKNHEYSYNQEQFHEALSLHQCGKIQAVWAAFIMENAWIRGWNRDVVTIRQVNHDSRRPETFEPYAEKHSSCGIQKKTESTQ
jgi:hypothetical protein